MCLAIFKGSWWLGPNTRGLYREVPEILIGSFLNTHTHIYIYIYSPCLLERTLLFWMSSYFEQNLASLKIFHSFSLFCVCGSMNIQFFEHSALSQWFLHPKPHITPLINEVCILFLFAKWVYRGSPIMLRRLTVYFMFYLDSVFFWLKLKIATSREILG